jgi:hypothetical protein
MARERATIPVRLVAHLHFFGMTFMADSKSLLSATVSFGGTENEDEVAVQRWDAVTGELRATFWSPSPLFAAGFPRGRDQRRDLIRGALGGRQGRGLGRRPGAGPADHRHGARLGRAGAGDLPAHAPKGA